MTRFFNSPFLLGFENLEKLLERTAKSAGEGYPPYNIETAEDGGLAITLAVAGFGKDELAVTVEDHQLVIRGRQQETEDKKFLHRGIAARQFLRAFVLAEGIEVKSAALENGLLRIDLVRPQIQPGVRVVEIVNGGQNMTDNFEMEGIAPAAGRIAYIKPTGSDEAHRLGLIPANIELPKGVKLYVLHAEDGSVLGFTDAYASAYGAAVENELTPVSLH